jgi:hypothetical protein
VLTTVLDLRRWQQALNGESILKSAAKDKLFHPFRDGYAYGWYVLKSNRGSPQIEHGGSTDNGFDCKLTHLPEQHTLSVVLGNLGDGRVRWVDANLGRLVRGEDVAFPPPIGKLDAERVHALEGSWEASGGTLFQVSVQDEAVVLDAQSDAALGFMLPSSSSRANALLKKTREIAKGLAKNEFNSLHAAEDRANPLTFFDKWWPTLEQKRGARTKLVVLGIVSDPKQGDSSLIRIDYAQGAEILRLVWSGEALVGTTIGAPYPSRRVLQTTAPNTWTEFDLVASKVLVELRLPSGDAKKTNQLELAANGKSLILTKRK